MPESSERLYFISYTRADGSDFADQLAKAIEEAGQHAWLDRRNIAVGDVWNKDLEEAIARCDAFLPILTNSYVKSNVCDNELQRALSKHKLILPLLVSRDAETPFLIQNIQYLDCSTGDSIKNCVAKLMQNGVRQPAAPPPRKSLAEHASANLSRFMRQRQGTSQRAGVYVPELYTARTKIETHFESFLSSDSSILLVLGNSGAGKTNLICNWAMSVAQRGHILLVYDCGQLQEFESEACLDLDATEGESLQRVLQRAAAEASGQGHCLVMVFDAISEFQDREHRGVIPLLNDIGRLIDRLDAGNVKIVLSCNAVAWLRQQRTLAPHLDSNRLFPSPDVGSSLIIGNFSNEELDDAYQRYQSWFQLQTPLQALPSDIRNSLRAPGLMRLVAEEHRGKELDLAVGGLNLGVYWKFFDQRVQMRGEVDFVNRLSRELLRRRTVAISLAELPDNEAWTKAVWDESPDSSYNRLLDSGVLEESRARLNTFLRFSNPQLAAYALAQHLLEQGTAPLDLVRDLIGQINAFPLAWDVAKTLLLLTLLTPSNAGSPDSTDLLVAKIAGSEIVEMRGLQCEVLVELHSLQPKQAEQHVQRLLDGESEYARRTAVKAAFQIGPATRSILLKAASGHNAVLQSLVSDTLYLIWRNESLATRSKTTDSLYLTWRYSPGFTYAFLNDLLGRFSVWNLTEIEPILEFILDLSITIYINHCEVPEVKEQTAALYKDLAINRLHLNMLSAGILGPAFESLVSGAVARRVSTQILEWAGLTESFFSLPLDRRACLARISDMLDPASDLQQAKADLEAMLESGVPIFSGAADLAIAVHASHDLASVEELIKALFDKASLEGKMWLIAGFSVLLPTTPATWIPLLENFTAQYLAMSASPLPAGTPKPRLTYDLLLLPLGLAYGKAGRKMEFFTAAIRQARSTGDLASAAVLLQAIGSIGYYYPGGAFDALRECMPLAGDATLRTAAVTALATIRTLHVDAVDEFLQEIHADDAFRRNVDASTSVERVGQLVHYLGYYNNAVHLCLNYPRMRRQLSADLLRRLATAQSFKEAAADYTRTFLHMFVESDFDLLRWTNAE